MDPEASSGPAQAGFRDEVNVIVAEPAWRRLVPHAESIATRAARAAGASGTVVLAADRTVRRLNARHRHRNQPTNVLTYTQPAPEMLLALGVIRREAAAAPACVPTMPGRPPPVAPGSRRWTRWRSCCDHRRSCPAPHGRPRSPPTGRRHGPLANPHRFDIGRIGIQFRDGCLGRVVGVTVDGLNFRTRTDGVQHLGRGG